MTHAAEQGQLVLFEALARAASVAEATPGHLGLDLLHRDLEPGRKTFDDDDEGLAVRFAGGEVAQHAREVTGSVRRAPGELRHA